MTIWIRCPDCDAVWTPTTGEPCPGCQLSWDAVRDAAEFLDRQAERATLRVVRSLPKEKP
jgi:hypothetical protein